MPQLGLANVSRTLRVFFGSAPDYRGLGRPAAPRLRHYDRIRHDLTDALRRHLKRFPEDRDLVAYAKGVDLPDSALISLHRRDLREITSRFAAIELLVSHEMEAIHRLEATTGQHGYSR